MTALATRMAAKNLTDAELAQRVECDRSTITKLRNGKAIPSLPLAVKIAKATGVKIEDLMS